MRLFFAGVMHESSVASPIPTTLASFQEQYWDPKSIAVAPDHVDTCAYGPIWELAGSRGHECFSAPYCMAQPSAPLQDAAWNTLKGSILADLAAAGPVNGVFLMLHGAQSSTSINDCEGDLLEDIRALVGLDIPIGAILDLHTNLTSRMLANATFLIACKEYPHTDYPERGVELLDLIEAVHEGRLNPVTVAVRIPVLGLFPTTIEPMRGFVRALEHAERAPIVSVSATHGFFDADHEDVSAAIIVIADSDVDAARSLAFDLSRSFVDIVTSQDELGMGLADALALARSHAEIVTLADVADNPGGGSSGDDTLMLQAFIDDWDEPIAFGMIWDPVSVQFCHDVGVGGVLDLRIGGKVGPRSGQPIDLRVEVISIRVDAKQAVFGMGQPRLPLGRTAAVRWKNIDIVLTDRRQQVFSRHCFTEHGIDLGAKRLICVKSTQHFYKDFAAISDHIIWCDPRRELTLGAGYTPFKKIKRPIYPIDPVTDIELEEFDF